jgi:hypothetical protein
VSHLERCFRHSMTSDLQIDAPNTANRRGKIFSPRDYITSVQNLFHVCPNLQLHIYSFSPLTVKLPVFISTMLQRHIYERDQDSRSLYLTTRSRRVVTPNPGTHQPEQQVSFSAGYGDAEESSNPRHPAFHFNI